MRRTMVFAADLILGARCAGCGAVAIDLCRACGESIRPAPASRWPPPVAEDRLTPQARVHACAGGLNSDTLRRVVVAWKEQGRSRLTPLLAHHLASAIVPHAVPGREIVLVPIPSSARSRRARGCDVVADLARVTAQHLEEVGVATMVVRALRHGRIVHDQVGLGAQARRDNLAGAFRLRRSAGLAGRDVVVVDDILTTGATVSEAVRVLTAAGFRPAGISVAAMTPRILGQSE